jgi:leader peptidase (prepilin peptidase)/N-methyltransferase
VITGALVMGGLVLRFTEPLTAAVFGAYLVALVLLLATDLDQRLLPNVITLPAIPLALGFDLLGLNPLVPPGVLPIAIVVAILVPGLLAALAIPFHADAIGQGDLRLLVSVGLLAGPLRMFSGVVYGAFAAGAVIVILLAMRRITLKSYIPFGPFLIIGAAWALLVIP